MIASASSLVTRPVVSAPDEIPNASSLYNDKSTGISKDGIPQTNTGAHNLGSTSGAKVATSQKSHITPFKSHKTPYHRRPYLLQTPKGVAGGTPKGTPQAPLLQSATANATTSGKNADSDENYITTSTEEPTVYTGRGLLPCSSFIFLAEAPPPRVGRRERLDHRAIFAMNRQSTQASTRYEAYTSSFAKSTPDWAVFTGGKDMTGKKKRPRETRRISGGRVRSWVE